MKAKTFGPCAASGDTANALAERDSNWPRQMLFLVVVATGSGGFEGKGGRGVVVRRNSLSNLPSAYS